MAAAGRDAAVGEVLARWLGESDVAPRAALVISERTRAAQRALGATPTTTWDRMALGGCAAHAWPEDGPFDLVVVRLPKGREALRMVIHAAAARMAPHGRLVLGGAKDEGVKSAARTLAEVFGDVRTVDTRRHCRVIEAKEPGGELRGALEDWSETVVSESAAGPLRWASWPGLFAHGRLDVGTGLLLDHLPPPASGTRVLDFGCGAGVIGLALRAMQPDLSYHGVDIDALAVHAASQNLPGDTVRCGDGLAKMDGGGFDLVVSNPPLHVGVRSDRGPIEAFLGAAAGRLAPGGAIWLVTQRTVPLQTLAEQASLHTPHLVATQGGFRVWRVGG